MKVNKLLKLDLILLVIFLVVTVSASFYLANEHPTIRNYSPLVIRITRFWELQSRKIPSIQTLFFLQILKSTSIHPSNSPLP